MRSRIIVGLGLVLMVCACSPQTAKDRLPMESGLQIDNGPSHGANYTNSQGTKFSLRYIPITIKNISTTPIHIQMALSDEYDYPATNSKQSFKAFLLSAEYDPDSITVDTLSYELGDNGLRNYFEKGFTPPYNLNKSLEPGQKCVVAFGTLYPNPTNCGVVPNALFLYDKRGLYKDCDSLSRDSSTDTPLALGIKLDFCSRDPQGSCMLIPCGQISYSTP